MTVVLIFALVAIAYWLIIRRFFPHAPDGRQFRGGTYGSGYTTPAHLRPDDTWHHQHTAHTSTVHDDNARVVYASDPNPAGADGSAYAGGGTDFGGFGGGGDFSGGGAGGGFGDSSYGGYADSSSYSDSGSSSSDSGSSSSSSSD